MTSGKTGKVSPQDELARKRIKTEIDRNFFVEAAAGSGKTTSLVDRMIAMVGAGIDVSKICAITFTKNAAKEFYGRFQEELMKISWLNENIEGKIPTFDELLPRSQNLVRLLGIYRDTIPPKTEEETAL